MSEQKTAIEKLRKQWRKEGRQKIRTYQKHGITILTQEEAARIREWMIRGDILGAADAGE